MCVCMNLCMYICRQICTILHECVCGYMDVYSLISMNGHLTVCLYWACISPYVCLWPDIYDYACVFVCIYM